MGFFLSEPSDPKAAARDGGFAARLAWLYAALFVMAGIQLPFFPVWLKANMHPNESVCISVVAWVVWVLLKPIPKSW